MNYTLEQHKKYRDWLVGSRYSDNVQKNYTYYSNGLIGKDITQETITNLCESAKAHAVYRCFLKTVLLCFDMDHIKVTKIRGRKEEKEVIYFTDLEMERILSNVKEYRLHLIIRLMYENGLRISEVMSLQVKSFDMINRRVKGMGKGNKEFNLQLQETTYKHLTKYLGSRGKEDYIFTWDVKHQRHKALYELKKTIKEILPNQEEKDIFCHAFRHTCGTHLMDQGMSLREVQKHLRHKQLGTVAAYTHVDERKLEKKLGDIFS